MGLATMMVVHISSLNVMIALKLAVSIHSWKLVNNACQILFREVLITAIQNYALIVQKKYPFIMVPMTVAVKSSGKTTLIKL